MLGLGIEATKIASSENQDVLTEDVVDSTLPAIVRTAIFLGTDEVVNEVLLRTAATRREDNMVTGFSCVLCDKEEK